MRHHLTSDLATARNDTGRTAYCGPVVVAAITDFPVSTIEDVIRNHRSDPKDAQKIIQGTTTEEVAAALAVFGFELEAVEDFHHLERKQRPTLWAWMQKPRSVWAHHILAVQKGKQGHWVCVKGTKICDTFTDGKWVFASEGPHRGARLMEVYTARRSPGVS
ncbi:MAG: hypothetical protein ACR2O4_01910 [Hyphomicrobiaceae bacterium]